MIRFRFENLEIWQRAVEVAGKLFKLAGILEEKKLFRFADQLRGSGLSMANNPVKLMKCITFMFYKAKGI